MSDLKEREEKLRKEVAQLGELDRTQLMRVAKEIHALRRQSGASGLPPVSHNNIIRWSRDPEGTDLIGTHKKQPAAGRSWWDKIWNG